MGIEFPTGAVFLNKVGDTVDCTLHRLERPHMICGKQGGTARIMASSLSGTRPFTRKQVLRAPYGK